VELWKRVKSSRREADLRWKVTGNMAADSVDFDTWISEKFVALNTDEAVFGPYVKSIVEGDETLEEKIEALDGILSELGDLDVEAFRKEILARWDQHLKAMACSSSNGVDGGSGEINLESKLESILRMNDDLKDTQPSSSQDKGPKGHTPDRALRAAILNQYQDSDDDLEAEGAAKSSSGGGGGAGGFSGLERNTNAERVQSEIKDKREREKADAAEKRAKDKEDRAKQKQQAQDRKDKAKKKATKVERKTR